MLDSQVCILNLLWLQRLNSLGWIQTPSILLVMPWLCTEMISELGPAIFKFCLYAHSQCTKTGPFTGSPYSSPAWEQRGKSLYTNSLLTKLLKTVLVRFSPVCVYSVSATEPSHNQTEPCLMSSPASAVSAWYDPFWL